MAGLRIVLVLMHNLFRNRRELALENLALRQQLTVFEAKKLRPRLRKRDRIFWVWLSRIWAGWRTVLVIVQPDTVIDWNRAGLRRYWRWKGLPGASASPIDRRK